MEEEKLEETEEEIAVGHHSIDKLIGNGISVGDIKKLQESGYHTVEQVAMATKKDLITVKEGLLIRIVRRSR